MKTNRKRYKIVVLSDLDKSSVTILKSSVGLAKMIKGDIEVFHVKKPSDIVDSENQLSAMRDINSSKKSVDKKIQKLIRPIQEENSMNIPYSFVFGNVKNEIEAFIKESQPDIIVLGERKSKTFNLVGDGITEFILNSYNGVVMINTKRDVIKPDKEFTLGALNSSKPFLQFEFAEDLIRHTQKPLKSFKIIKNSGIAREASKPKDDRTIEYVFEHSDATIKNLSNYLSKNNINLLSIDRERKDPDNGQELMMPDINGVIGRLNTNILISAR